MRRVIVVLLLAVLAAPAAARAADCPLPGGTAGAPEPATPGRDGSADALAPAPAGVQLPDRVPLKTPTLSRNRRWYFALDAGRLYVKPNVERTGADGPWRHVDTPACLDGAIRQISADDDELVATDAERRIYTMDQALSTPDAFNWTSRWGFPFWAGPGFTVPAGARAWAWSVISPREDVDWVDPAGNLQPIGDGKVSHVWSLGPDGRRLTFNDPWLPLDRSYEMCGPRRGRLASVALATSGSEIVVMDRFGDLYTRLFDFDISGLDNLFFHYSYDDQRGVANPPIQLPPAQWVQQPKVPGAITSLVSVEKLGAPAVHRTLRVEGTDAAGHTGYWEKDVVALDPAAWRFVPTGAPLLGTPVDNVAGDASDRVLGPPGDARYVRPRQGTEPYVVEIPDFSITCSPATLRVRFDSGRVLDLALHVVDRIRTEPRAAGLDATPRAASGTIEVTDAARRAAAGDAAAEALLRGPLGERRFTGAEISATTHEVDLSGIGWALARAADPPGGACVTEPGFASASVTPASGRVRATVARRTESPATAEVRRGTHVVARMTGTGPFAWPAGGTHPHAGIATMRLTTLTPGGRVDARAFALRIRRGRVTVLGPTSLAGACTPLRSASLARPSFGRRRSLVVRVATTARTAMRISLARHGRTVRRARTTVDPAGLTRVRVNGRALPAGRYRVTVAAGTERAVLAAWRTAG